MNATTTDRLAMSVTIRPARNSHPEWDISRHPPRVSSEEQTLMNIRHRFDAFQPQTVSAAPSAEYEGEGPY